VILFLILQNNNQQNTLFLTTHLPFAPQNGLLKFGIIILAFKTILEILKMYKINDIIFGGDFNFIPNSFLYEFISRNIFDPFILMNEYSNQSLVLKINYLKNLKLSNQITDKKYKPFEKLKADDVRENFYYDLLNLEILLSPLVSKKVYFHKKKNKLNMNNVI